MPRIARVAKRGGGLTSGLDVQTGNADWCVCGCVLGTALLWTFMPRIARVIKHGGGDGAGEVDDNAWWSWWWSDE
jgi:hypothetical protein